MKCVKCGEEIDKVSVGIDFGMWGEEKKDPNGTVFQEAKSPATAYVCKKCGYIEFYAQVKE